MWTYKAPLREIRFVIEDLFDAPASWARTPAFADLDTLTARQILEEAARFAGDVLVPLNSVGDREACTWRDGTVETPPGYPAAYAAFVEGGWPALACDPHWGGQGLPQLLNTALYEMLSAANHAWTMYPALLHGAYECLKAHGSAALQAGYLPRLVSGEWLSTMCLTEPQAGSDLGLVRTKAEPAGDGSWRIIGTKTFISGGEHDLTPNIVHLVLCRLPDAPAGTKGLSLLLAPKMLSDGSRNAIRCDGIEKKMGIKGSATCVLNFDGATGWLIGEPHRGLAAMFVMMNAARLHVGLQGLGHLEAASQNALAYARERVQMRAAVRPPGGKVGAAADPIVWHPALRRVLLTLQAQCDAARVLAYWTAQLLDEAETHPDEQQRTRAQSLAALLTPIVKAFLTDLGHRGADDALQVYGGYGYIHEYGIEQAVRDSRIAMIYEGTNEIQAIDLLLRKVLDDGGRRLDLLLEELDAAVARCTSPGKLAPFAEALSTQIDHLRAGTTALLAGRASDPEWPLRVADDYLHGCGWALFAWAWARIARHCAGSADAWKGEMLARARFGVSWLLPQADARWRRVSDQAAALPWLPPSDA